MALCAARDDPQSAFFAEHPGHHTCIGDDLFLVALEAGFERFLEGHRLGSDDMHQGAALQARENCRIDGLLVLRLHQDDAAARPAQGLVRGRGDDVGVGDRVGVVTRRDQPCVMRHIYPEDRTDFLGDLGEALEVDAQRIRGGTGDDDARLVFAGKLLHRVVIDLFFCVETVGDDVEPLARHVERHAVGEVAAFGKTHAHDRVAGLGKGHQYRLVGLRTGVRLHVGGFGTENLLDPCDCQRFGNIHVFAATVIALAGVAFSVLVCQLGALGLHHWRAHVVLGSDQFDVIFLAAVLGLNGSPEFRIGLGNGALSGKHGWCSRMGQG